MTPPPTFAGALTRRKPRNQAAGMDDLPALLRAIDGYATISDNKPALAMRLSCLTFVRTVELIGAE